MAEVAPRRLTTVFLDRDGVVNVKAPEGDYVKSWAEFAFLPTALDGLRLLAAQGLRTVVVTNQRGIARGAMSEEDLDDIHARMRTAVEEAGGQIDAIYHCPHAGGCDCRKPAPGMLRAAARDHPGLRFDESALVGDRVHDMQAAAAVGALRVYLRGFDEPLPEVDHVTEDLLGAASWLVRIDDHARGRR
jgi:D-glycero-D-manno-heptose 1,7-bisphosphate phosphatase